MTRAAFAKTAPSGEMVISRFSPLRVGSVVFERVVE
jgi:hypothetical protein